MSGHQWERVTATFHVAVEKPPAERAAFLDAACAEDAWLRREVETLLASYEAAGGTASFVREAMEALALRVDEALSPGQRLGRYEVEAPLGAGGMGAVYLAHDTSLGRKVALKVLPTPLAANPLAMRRFQQEARLASGLNHPGIVTVHEIGHDRGVPYIATELIDGETLRARMKPGGLDALQAVPLALQVGSALAAAHRAGIVHRDIKPENIMVRADGLVKVLDFGLAKPEPAGAPSLTTAPGLVMGTVSYMSPEQARGLAVDARADIWSFGVVLYEMLSGRLPFSGPTTADVIVAILEREPPPLADAEHALPAAMAEAVMRCLAKDREGRYRTMDELLAALQGAAADTRSRRIPPARRRIVSVVTAGAVVAALLALGYSGRRDPAPLRDAGARMTAITNTGNVAAAAVSRDGSAVAYVMEESGQQSVWIRRRDGSRHEALISPAPAQYRGLTFSPDGGTVHVVADFEHDDTFTLYRVPAQGGQPQETRRGVDSPVGFSPDGSRLAFVRRVSAAETELVVTGVQADSGERILLARHAPASLVEVAPAWSPDGTAIAVTLDEGGEAEAGAGADDSRGGTVHVVTIDVATGAVRPLGDRKWRWAGAPAWLGDGRTLLVPIATRTSTLGQIVRLAYPEGSMSSVTQDLNSYLAVSATADPASFIALRRELRSGVWVGDAPGGPATKVTRGEGKYFYNLSWTLDGRIVCASAESGSWDLWVLDPTAKTAWPLTSGPAIDAMPEVSADGRDVVFQSNRGGSRNLWRIGTDGRGSLRQLTRGGGEYNPQASPQGWVAYTSYDTGEPTAWRVAIDGGGEPVRIGTGALRDPAVSPDGRFVAGHYQEHPGSPWRIAVLSVAGPSPVRILDVPGAGTAWQLVRWIPGTEAVSYIEARDDVHNLWAWTAGRPPRPLTRFESGRIFSYAWSRDGKRLACIRGVHNRDVVQVRLGGP